MQVVPESALQYGFVNDPIGSHTSRTMMLAELQTLLSARAADAPADDYRRAVIDENVLGRGTVDSRRRSYRQLRELYGLDPEITIYRVLRRLWDADPAAQPLLALLCATARDPLLRATAAWIVDVPLGIDVTPEQLSDVLERAFPGRYKPSVREVTARNLAGTWRQAGHLSPAPSRQRARAASGPTSTAYALLLGHLGGDRGGLLFQTLWARLLDQPVHQIHEQASVASRQGWLEYRHAGDVTEITFRRLLDAEGVGV